jgi:hypothetical protein
MRGGYVRERKLQYEGEEEGRIESYSMREREGETVAVWGRRREYEGKGEGHHTYRMREISDWSTYQLCSVSTESEPWDGVRRVVVYAWWWWWWWCVCVVVVVCVWW